MSDADLVTQVIRFAVDIGQWKKLAAMWHARLLQADYQPSALDQGGGLQAHFDALAPVVDSMNPGTVEDPIEHFMLLSRGASMVINHNMQVVAVSEEGRTAFGIEQGQRDNLNWIDPAFRGAVLREISGRETSNRHYFPIRILLPDRRNGLAELCPIGSSTEARGLIGIRTLELQWDQTNADFLAEAFGLTKAEIGICRLLFDGYRLEEISQQRAVSLATVRTQLHAIFQKTEAANQVELLLLLVKLNSRSVSEGTQDNYRWSDPLGREQIIIRPDGMRLAYTWMGAAEGAPAIFIHGGTHGYLFPEAFEATLVKRGIRLVIPSRPGFGNSDRNEALDCAADLELSLTYLCSHLALAPVPVIAVHYAAIPVAKLAASSANPFSTMIAIGDIMRYGKISSRGITAQAKVFNWLARYAPWVNETNFRTAFRHLRSKSALGILRVHFNNHVYDLQSLDRPELAAPIRNAVHFVTKNGYRADLEDESLRVIDIMPFVRAMPIPFHLMQGDIDSLSAEGAKDNYYDKEIAELVENGTIASHRRIPHAAFFVFYQNPGYLADAIADTILATSQRPD